MRFVRIRTKSYSEEPINPIPSLVVLGVAIALWVLCFVVLRWN